MDRFRVVFNHPFKIIFQHALKSTRVQSTRLHVVYSIGKFITGEGGGFADNIKKLSFVNAILFYTF